MNSKTLRLIIPFFALVAGFFVVLSIFTATKQAAPTTTQPLSATASPETSADPNSALPTEPAAELTDAEELESPAPPANSSPPATPPAATTNNNTPPISQPEESAPAAEPTPQPVVETATPLLTTANGLHFKAQPPVTDANFMPMGDFGDETVNPARMVLEMSERGAGIRQITLLDYYKTIDHAPENRYTMLDGIPENRPALGLRAITIDGQRLDATGVYTFDPSTGRRNFSAPAWAEANSSHPTRRVYTAEVLDADEQPILRITRIFELGTVPGQLTITQSVKNLTSAPHDIMIEQWGPADLPGGDGQYGDFRRFRFGYLDPRSTQDVFASEGDYLKQRNSILGNHLDDNNNTLWPNEASQENNYSLSWAGVTNRYFAFVVHPDLPDPANALDKRARDIAQVQFYLDSPVRRLSDIPEDLIPLIYTNLKLVSPTWTLAPGAQRSFNLGAYAGPQLAPLLAKTEPYKAFRFSEFIVYQLGCAVCTFQWLAHILIEFLRLIHGILGDWGLSIIVLVLVVRGLLHPLTKKGQISMQKMGKKMGKLQPEIAKLKEKYKDNPKKLQKEQMALYKEHNVNPAGCLGMLPMVLQMPIWVALYAMLYFAIELRQEPFAYGVFQLINNWSFLADLSQPDNFIDFGGPIPFLKGIPLVGSIVSLNILPLMMGAFFYLQQKYMTPPNPNMTPEQETQQKIMRVLFPLMMPIFLYNAPAGLTMYILTSSCIGIIESRYIRAHVTALDLDGNGNGPGAEPKKPGFAARFMSSYGTKIEKAQALLEEKQRAKSGAAAGPKAPSRNKKGGYSKRKPGSS